MPRKFPIWSTVDESNRLLWTHREQLFTLTWTWLLVMVPVYAIAHWLDQFTPSWFNLPGLVEIPFLASIAVGWHRLLLEARHVAAPYLNLDKSVLRYAAYSLVFWAWWLVFAVFDVVDERTAWIIGTAYAVVTLLGLILVGRVLLIFPAIAVGSPVSLHRSWHLTQGNTWRLLCGSLCAVLPMLIVLSVISGVTPSDQGMTSKVVLATLTSVVSAIGVTAGVSFLSLAYCFFTAGEQAAA